MIPLHLKLSGFLSYRDPVELDFTSFDLACISGPNGAGKSSLLDAITWALFGQARKRDESLVNSQPGVKAAEVIFTFAYEENIYRVQRTLPRGKTTILEFQIQDSNLGGWRPLTERALRETQARIEQILRLDYETFVNAAFFLQGKADQFAQQSPGKRKEILSNILGLEIWEIYKERATERRRLVERDLTLADDRIREIDSELAEEDSRKQRLAELEAGLRDMARARKIQESALENLHRVMASLDQQRKLVETLAAGLERSSANLSGLQARLAEREAERNRYADLLARASAVESAYRAWRSARAELERWEQIAGQFREHEKRRQPLLDEINAEKARLEQERDTLLNQQKVISEQLSVSNALQTELDNAKKALVEAEAQVKQRAELEMQAQASREKQAELRAENVSLKAEMDELKARIDKLEATDGAVCPLCGQALSPAERQNLIAQLAAQGGEMGDRWRANKTALEEFASNLTNLESLLSNLSTAADKRLALASVVSQLTERLETLQKQAAEWELVGMPRLAEITFNLQDENFAPQARARLAEVDRELAGLGYDALAHDAARRSEVEGRSAEADFRDLESARAALKPLDDEIANLHSSINNQQLAISHQQAEYDSAVAIFTTAQAQAPDLESAERALFDLQEQENRFNQEVGAARQKVAVLDGLRARKVRLEAERGDFGLAIGRLKSLERAFGKDGVPALLIEQALPEIESKANELLDRLSGGAISVRFITQAAFKDKKREDLRETLDIQISDSAGARDYEMFSIDGSEPVYIRRNGRIISRQIQELWEEQNETKIDGEYEFQDAGFEALCYNNGKSTWMPAQSILRHSAPKEMLKLTFTPGRYSVKITPNHSIIVMTTEGLQIKRGDEVQPGDYVLTPRNIPAEKIQEQVDLIDWISPEFITKRQIDKNKLNWNDYLIWSRIDRPINRLVQNGESLAEFLGLVVAEGSGKTAYTISAGTDKVIAQKAVDLSNVIFGSSRQSIGWISAELMGRYTMKQEGFSALHPEEQYRPFVGGRLVAHILGNMAGQGAERKHIPGPIFNTPEEGKIAFLMGLISGDGHIRIRPEKNQVEIAITTVSPQLVADTIFLCRQLGIWACGGEHGNAGFRRGAEHQRSYRISINGGSNAGRLIDPQILKYSTRSAFDGIPLDLIGIVRNTKQRKMKRISPDALYPCGARVLPKRSQEVYQKMLRWLEDWAVLEVVSIEKVQPTTPFVYDLVVPENHTFVAGTGLILVHNSGGEAFRVNFAIRLALSEVLAQRKGARLQTLVIDEGFGSQDAQGRQRLIEAINAVRGDFAKILIITHLDELKDVFPTRIEVEKTERGSVVKVI